MIGSISLVNYVRDANEYCWYITSSFLTSYTSNGMAYDADEGEYVVFHSSVNGPGATKQHNYDGDPTSGKLKLSNHNVPGQTCYAKGKMS